MKVRIFKNDTLESSYLVTIQIKPYKQWSRIIKELRKWMQMQEDEEHGKIRFYYFKGDGWIINESELCHKG